MKVLVVGNGGREHAIAWKLLQSPQVEQVLCIPGNGGTATLENCHNYPIAVNDFEKIAQLAQQEKVDFVAVGPELPLSLGITDYLKQHNIPVFGPSKAGAEIEASKAWAKDLMIEANVPTATSETFTNAEAARAYITQTGAPIVVKADGLAAGKGVTVAFTEAEALAAVNFLFNNGFEKVVVEEYLTGQEVSVLALTDGITIRPLVPAQDHKQIGEGDTGANTGGMGAYAPTPVATKEIMAKVESDVLLPTLQTLQKRGIDYRGILYAGLMITPEGEPKVLEYNCRFGDPETQAVLALLETPLEDLMLACVEQRLEDFPPIQWKAGSAVCVVLAAGGYPEKYEKGDSITGISAAEDQGAKVFHAGTKLENEQVITDGGRVLGVTAVGETFESAITQTYEAVKSIHFDNMYYRSDIGHRVQNQTD